MFVYADRSVETNVKHVELTNLGSFFLLKFIINAKGTMLQDGTPNAEKASRNSFSTELNSGYLPNSTYIQHKKNTRHIMGEYHNKNTKVFTQKTATIKISETSCLRNCFCKDIPGERLYLDTGLAVSICKLGSCLELLKHKKSSTTTALRWLLCPSHRKAGWLLQLWLKVASPGPGGRQPKGFSTQLSVAAAAWHLIPRAVAFNLPVTLRGLEPTPQPTTALAVVFSGL